MICLCVYVCVEGDAMDVDPEDMLDRQKCLDALAAVRRVKWFHVRLVIYLSFSR